MRFALLVNLWADGIVTSGVLGGASFLLTPIRFLAILVAALVIFIPIYAARGSHGGLLAGLLTSLLGYGAALHAALAPSNAVHGIIANYAVFAHPIACLSYGLQRVWKVPEGAGAVVDAVVDHYTDPPSN